mmetsp:Transcript_103351/g.178099  ORF Transcript_103351/g.178099 Transcript_103351/m.178099 type:complete len:107 (-) Transcript_103351:988-1308(-)
MAASTAEALTTGPVNAPMLAATVVAKAKGVAKVKAKVAMVVSTAAALTIGPVTAPTAKVAQAALLAVATVADGTTGMVVQTGMPLTDQYHGANNERILSGEILTCT